MKKQHAIGHNTLQLPAERTAGVALLKAGARAAAEARFVAIEPALLKIVDQGLSPTAAANWLADTRGDRPPETYRRFIVDYQRHGLAGLVPAHTGRVRKEYGWEARCVELFQLPSSPKMGTVATWLQDEGHDSATASRVRRYINSLPKSVTTASPKRVGKNFHRNNLAPHEVRDVSDLNPGEAWVSDGHKIKVISRDPVSDEFHRLELTAILDVATNYLLGWWWSKAESAESTVYAFCSVARKFGGFPVWFYSDVGSGFNNARTQTLFAHAGTTHGTSIPGTPKSKGLGEGIFKILTERFSKRFESYSGMDRTDDVLARFRTKYKRGELHVRTDTEVMSRFAEWAEQYNNRPQPYSERIKNRAPAEFLDAFALQPMHLDIADLIRPEAECTVQSCTVRLVNRWYLADVLADYEAERIRVQYDTNDESVVWLFDPEGRYLGEGQLRRKVPWARESAAADAREQARVAAVARKQRQIDQINNLHGGAINSSPASSDEALARGHSLPAPAQRPVIEAPKLDASAQVLMQELRKQPTAKAPTRKGRPLTTQEERAQRWQRASELEEQMAAGEAVPEKDAAWLERYRQLPEYRTQLHIQTKKLRGALNTPEPHSRPAPTGQFADTNQSTKRGGNDDQ